MVSAAVDDLTGQAGRDDEGRSRALTASST